jgi:hypothetical protein
MEQGCVVSASIQRIAKQTSASVRVKTTSSKAVRYFSKFIERYKTNEVEYRKRYKYQHMAVRINVEKQPAPGVLFWSKSGFLSFTVNSAPLKDCCLNETGRLFWFQGACYPLSQPTKSSFFLCKPNWIITLLRTVAFIWLLLGIGD